MQTLFPCLYFMTTVSMSKPSESAKRYFVVPSAGSTSFRRISSVASAHSARSFSRRLFERSVIASKLIAPRPSHAKICFARKEGSPRDFMKFSRSGKVRVEMSVINMMCAAFSSDTERSATSASRKRNAFFIVFSFVFVCRGGGKKVSRGRGR